MSDDQAHLLAAAANQLGGEEEEVSSGATLAPEAAAADLKRWVGAWWTAGFGLGAVQLAAPHEQVLSTVALL